MDTDDMFDTIELKLGILIIEFLNKYSTLLQYQRTKFINYLKDDLRAFDDNFSFIFDNLLEILYFETDVNEIERIIDSFIDVYKLDKKNVELCIKYCLEYLNDFMFD